MNMLVCVKQVPDTTEIKIDPVKNTLIREGVPSIVNPFDGYALAIAADKAYLVSGRAFGGSDTLATSYIISEAIKKVEEKEGKFDVIFCGKQAIDGDTAQVGPEIAEHLNYPQVTYGLEAEVDGDTIKVKKEVEEGVEVIAANHAGMRVCGVSCVANLAAGLSDRPLDGDEVIEAANAAAPKFKKLMWDSIAAMHTEEKA